jgi:hypothetical protein
MEYVYLDLGGCEMNGIIGKSDDWTKIFGLKHDVSPKIFGLKLEKILDISRIIKIWDVDLGRPSAVRRPVFLRHFIPFTLIMVLDYAIFHIISVRIHRF